MSSCFSLVCIPVMPEKCNQLKGTCYSAGSGDCPEEGFYSLPNMCGPVPENLCCVPHDNGNYVT